MSINLENVVLASPEQMEFIIQGMRNPMNSWEKSDSGICSIGSGIECDYCSDYASCDKTIDDRYHLGLNDHSLMQRLSNAGTEHRKYMRMMPVYVRITAPLYWWKEFDTYKVEQLQTPAVQCTRLRRKNLRWRISLTNIWILLLKHALKQLLGI